MSSSKFTYALPSSAPSHVVREEQIEYGFIGKLQNLKYEYRADIRDRAALERNFREKFEALNRVKLSDGEFARLLDEIVTPDVFTAAKTLRSINAFTREDGTPLNYTLVNIKDWCKNTFEVVNQLRINTDYSHHRYDVLILINGVPCVQIELKTLGINPRRAMEQIVDYKNDPGNGYTKTLLSFLQLFIVSNRTNTYYFANNNARHFAFNSDERFLPIYQFADEANNKITQLDEFADKFLVKCTLGQTISRYMVLVASEQKLLMMRPYQVYAVKQIVDCIHQNCGNGYIWHTTGSGKTLTSFKASTLLKDIFIDDPVSSLDEHNIYVTAESIFQLVEIHYLKKRVIVTTHHMGLFSILADRLTKGSKGGRYKNLTKLCVLTRNGDALSLVTPNNSVFLFHLHVLQLLVEASRGELFMHHIVMLRQVLENVASFIGRPNFGFTLTQIGVADVDDAVNVINSLSHKDAYYYQSNLMPPAVQTVFRDVLEKLLAKYKFDL